jgi:GTPase SAR1 family protein
MGNFLFSKSRARQRSLNIDTEMLKEFKEACDGIKVLVLGTANTGKSTIIKQLRILYGEPYTRAELERYKRLVHSNALSFMTQLYELAIEEGDGILSEKDENGVYCLSPAAEIDAETAMLLNRLWIDPGIQQAYLDRAKRQIPESAKYFITKAGEFAHEDYLPTVEDILQIRIPTKKLITKNIIIDGTTFTFFDASAQENKRKKWLYKFKDVQVVLFVAGLGDFDVISSQDPTRNKLDLSIDIFKEAIETVEFKDKTFILLLNKMDVLQEKVRQSIDPAHVHDPSGKKPWHDYNSDEEHSYLKAQKYFLERFKTCHTRVKQPIVNCICGLESEFIDTVFRGLENAIIKDYMKQSIFSSMTVSATAQDKMSKFKRAGIKAALNKK